MSDKLAQAVEAAAELLRMLDDHICFTAPNCDPRAEIVKPRGGRFEGERPCRMAYRLRAAFAAGEGACGIDHDQLDVRIASLCDAIEAEKRGRKAAEAALAAGPVSDAREQPLSRGARGATPPFASTTPPTAEKAEPQPDVAAWLETKLALAVEALLVTLGQHMRHWDAKGTRGDNCPVCIEQREAAEAVRAALAAAPEPIDAVAFLRERATSDKRPGCSHWEHSLLEAADALERAMKGGR